MEFISEYGLFLAKSVTIVIALLIVVGGIVAIGARSRPRHEGHIEVKSLNDKFKEMELAIKSTILNDQEWKQEQKKQKKDEKESKKKHKKHHDEVSKKRIYVLEFEGDIKASAVEHLRHEVSAILTMARPEDEVMVCLESPGGLVHSYGLAASQLKRITSHSIPLTVAVDKVAASGGYMMACIANKILAAPFAVLGSIGVLAQLPNFHRLLQKNDIDFELLTAGEYKRTLTMFGENTDKGRQKFVEELEDTHQLFKDFVAENRPQLDIQSVATGEVWYGQRALDKKLIDVVQTSDDYLQSNHQTADIFLVKYEQKKTLQERVGMSVSSAVERVVERCISRLFNPRQY